MAKQRITIKTDVNGKPISSFVRSLEQTFPKAAAAALKAGMEVYLETISGDVRRRTYREAGLNVRSGDLLRSIGARTAKGVFGVTAKASGRKVQISGQIGSRLIYADVQEHGARIQARNAAFLSFPILAPGGGLRVVGWARKKSVVIPARPYLRPAIEGSKAKGAKLFKIAYDRAMTEALR